MTAYLDIKLKIKFPLLVNSRNMVVPGKIGSFSDFADIRPGLIVESSKIFKVNKRRNFLLSLTERSADFLKIFCFKKKKLVYKDTD